MLPCVPPVVAPVKSLLLKRAKPVIDVKVPRAVCQSIVTPPKCDVVSLVQGSSSVPRTILPVVR